MIISFRDKHRGSFFEGERVKAFQGFERQAMLRLEGLKGDRKGQYSIRINDQWRICFEWPESSPGPVNVEIVDYH